MRVRSASWLFSAQTLSLAVGFPLSVLLARTLGPSGKGILSLVQLIATMGAAVLNLGLGSAFTYYAARGEARGRDAVRLSLALSFIGSVLLLVVALASGTQAARALLETDGHGLLYLGSLAVGPVLLTQLMVAFLVGAGSVRAASLVSIVSVVFQLGADVALLALGRLTPATAVAVWFIAVVGSALGASRLAWPRGQISPSAPRGGPVVAAGTRALFRRGIGYGLTSWGASVLAILSLRQDMFLIAYFLGTTEVGIYSIAVTLAELAWLVPGSLNGIVIPKVAAEGRGTAQLTAWLTRLVWPLTLVLSGALVALAVPLVPAVFGKAFAASIVPLALLTPGMVFIALAGIPSAYLMGIGSPRDWTIASLANLVVNVTGNLILIPRFAVAGAAVASSVSYAVAAVIVIGFFRARSGLTLGEMLVPRPADLSRLWAAVRGSWRPGELTGT